MEIVNQGARSFFLSNFFLLNVFPLFQIKVEPLNSYFSIIQRKKGTFRNQWQSLINSLFLRPTPSLPPAASGAMTTPSSKTLSLPRTIGFAESVTMSQIFTPLELWGWSWEPLCSGVLLLLLTFFYMFSIWIPSQRHRRLLWPQDKLLHRDCHRHPLHIPTDPSQLQLWVVCFVQGEFGKNTGCWTNLKWTKT